MSEQTKRTPEEIEADLARTRVELTSTVNELSDRLDPRAQLESAKVAAAAKARTFTDQLRHREPKAIATAAAGVAAVVLVVLRRRSR